MERILGLLSVHKDNFKVMIEFSFFKFSVSICLCKTIDTKNTYVSFVFEVSSYYY